MKKRTKIPKNAESPTGDSAQDTIFYTSLQKAKLGRLGAVKIDLLMNNVIYIRFLRQAKK